MTIRMLTMATLQLAQLKEFYCMVLGLPLAEEDDNSFVVQAGTTGIRFQQHAYTTEPVYHFAFNIPANKIEEANTWIATRAQRLYLKDYNSFIADFTNWHAKSVYFYDPAGNVVELIARFDLNNAATEPFSARQWLSVSEIGLVFPATEFERKTQQVLSDYHLSWFSKQPPLEQFRVAGDDEGLFIMVPENRPWYPTNDARAIIAPLKIYFSPSPASSISTYTAI